MPSVRTHEMIKLVVTADMRGRMCVSCPDDKGWVEMEFGVDPIDLQAHVYAFLCPRCGDRLVWDGRRVHEDALETTERGRGVGWG